MATPSLELGPVIAAVDGLVLTAADRRRLRHPQVGGLTLFARNYADREQLTAFCAEIHALRTPRLLIAVDHEGGRVQRFREQFTALPAMRRIGKLWDCDRDRACTVARAVGFTMAFELRACGVDLSFAPVLDIDHGASTIIGDRAFHTDPAAIVELADALISGMHDGGMAAVGKHFPGHGYIVADSHLELPVDPRPLEGIEKADLVPFRRLCSRLASMMPAHVLYPAVDDRPAGFSRRWLGDILREQLGFEGAILSDDLGMEGAAGEGAMASRAAAALHAGCDLVLACTAQGSDELLTRFDCQMSAASRRRLAAMFGAPLGRGQSAADMARLEQARETIRIVVGA